MDRAVIHTLAKTLLHWTRPTTLAECDPFPHLWSHNQSELVARAMANNDIIAPAAIPSATAAALLADWIRITGTVSLAMGAVTEATCVWLKERYPDVKIVLTEEVFKGFQKKTPNQLCPADHPEEGTWFYPAVKDGEINKVVTQAAAAEMVRMTANWNMAKAMLEAHDLKVAGVILEQERICRDYRKTDDADVFNEWFGDMLDAVEEQIASRFPAVPVVWIPRGTAYSNGNYPMRSSWTQQTTGSDLSRMGCYCYWPKWADATAVLVNERVYQTSCECADGLGIQVVNPVISLGCGYNNEGKWAYLDYDPSLDYAFGRYLAEKTHRWQQIIFWPSIGDKDYWPQAKQEARLAAFLNGVQLL